ncbi:MAG: DUF1501 domain-containing protein [Verrucomicrobiales bacterium]
MMKSHHPTDPRHLFLTRRDFLTKCTLGMGALGFGALVNEGGAADLNPLASRKPHFAPKVKRVIHIFANGGPSHVDTFDPKPALDKWHGQKIPNHLGTERPTGGAWKSPYKFTRHGQSGIPVSEIFPNVAKHVDELCIVRSMHADVPNHEPSLLMMNCGESRLVRPSVGAWVTYGLGTDNQNLPGFITMCPGGYPIQESQNWQAGFLPGAYQGTYIDTKHREIEKLIENISNKTLNRLTQRRQIDLLQELNRRHLEQRGNDAQLEARVQSFELAYRMQMEATDAFDINLEPEAVRKLYGDHVQGRQLLIARRLIERGVRFVQVWHGEGQPWDNHDDLADNHRRLAKECDQPIAALLTDLKERGLLDDTLVMWGGEFGRTPTVELPTPGSNAGKINGRDHNHYGFTLWLAGGGVKKGFVFGATDEFGFKAVENPVHPHDLHATILNLLGFDHESFTYRHAGLDFRLTGFEGARVVQEILA